jgi:hypothetical protein
MKLFYFLKIQNTFYDKSKLFTIVLLLKLVKNKKN